MYKNNVGAGPVSAQKGITLIALVITIIVMLILVGVTISMAVNGGLFEKAGEAVGKTNNALRDEQQLAEGGVKVGDTWYNSIDEYLVASGHKPISKTISYVGYYADVDGDGEADGVIYADLAFDSSTIRPNGYDFTYEAIPEVELKDYTVCGTTNGPFGNGKEVLSALGVGKDRFYVMALEDVASSPCTWYDKDIDSGITVDTELWFGYGKENTTTMLGIWNDNTDQGKSVNDLWGVIQDTKFSLIANEADSSKWFVPSWREWAAFDRCLQDLFGDDYTVSWTDRFELSDYYWTSSQEGEYEAWRYDPVSDGDFSISSRDDLAWVRLSATF